MAKVYITKYALSTGIEEIETELYKSPIDNRYYTQVYYNRYYIG